MGKKQELDRTNAQIAEQADHLNALHEEKDALIQDVSLNRNHQSEEAALYLGATHEMRIAANAILGMTEIAKNNEQNPGRLIDCHHRIESSAEYLSSLLENVSIYSQIVTEEVPKEESIDLYSLLEQCILDKTEKGKEQGIEVNMEGSHDFDPPRIKTIPSYLTRIFSILLDNGIQYNKAHGAVVIKPEVLSSNEETVLCQFMVCDTGIGMSEAFISHLFEPFTREHAKLYESWHNTGLSLSIAKRMIDAMNGTITVESTPAIGTNFTITLPFLIDRGYVVENGDTNLSHVRMLLADGNSLNRQLISHQLGKAGILVETAYDGRVAVNKFERSTLDYYQYILIDSEIPIMTAVETISAIRDLSHPDAKTVKIVGMSRHMLASDIEPLTTAGANLVLEKPLDVEKLIEMIKSPQ